MACIYPPPPRYLAALVTLEQACIFLLHMTCIYAPALPDLAALVTLEQAHALVQDKALHAEQELEDTSQQLGLLQACILLLI
jgi:hypothetical protein